MLIPVKINGNIHLDNVEITNTNFKSLNVKEDQIEDFLRANIEVIFQDETLLVVGQQVVNKANGRSDLTAIDENGNLVLIEIKRDIEDMKYRREPMEFQAIRYAASYAKIKTTEELVDKIFATYIDKYKEEFELGDLTAYEKATRILNDFLEKNNAQKTFNSKQRIILIASSFDAQTLSAVAWLITNNVDISCFELSPMIIGQGHFIEINRILPPPSIEDYYIDIDDKKHGVSMGKSSSITRTYLPRMDKLFEWGIIKKGDIISIRNFEDSDAEVKDVKYVIYKGELMPFNQWGEKVTGWSAISIYEWTKINELDKTLDELRREKMIEYDSINDEFGGLITRG